MNFDFKYHKIVQNTDEKAVEKELVTRDITEKRPFKNVDRENANK